MRSVRSSNTRSADRPDANRRAPAVRLVGVVLFYEILLVVCTLVITWFALYALYRLITDES